MCSGDERPNLLIYMCSETSISSQKQWHPLSWDLNVPDYYGVCPALLLPFRWHTLLAPPASGRAKGFQNLSHFKKHVKEGGTHLSVSETTILRVSCMGSLLRMLLILLCICITPADIKQRNRSLHKHPQFTFSFHINRAELLYHVPGFIQNVLNVQYFKCAKGLIYYFSNPYKSLWCTVFMWQMGRAETERMMDCKSS